jgi:ribokinase
VPAIKVKLVSTHCAGCEFTGVLAAELSKSSEIAVAIEAANQAAATLVSAGNQTRG